MQCTVTRTSCIFVCDGHQVSDPFVREMFLADENKPLPNIAADTNAPPVVLMPNGLAIGGGPMPTPMGPTPMAPMGGQFHMMGGGMPMGPMGPMGPIAPPGPQQMGPMGGAPMQLQPPQGEPNGLDVRCKQLLLTCLVDGCQHAYIRVVGVWSRRPYQTTPRATYEFESSSFNIFFRQACCMMHSIW